jgi:hypothetical protein
MSNASDPKPESIKPPPAALEIDRRDFLEVSGVGAAASTVPEAVLPAGEIVTNAAATLTDMVNWPKLIHLAYEQAFTTLTSNTNLLFWFLEDVASGR